MKATVIGGPDDGKVIEIRGPLYQREIVVAHKPMMACNDDDIVCYFDNMGYPIFPQTRLRRTYTYKFDATHDGSEFKFSAVLVSWKDSQHCLTYAAPGAWIWEDGFGPDKDRWLAKSDNATPSPS